MQGSPGFLLGNYVVPSGPVRRFNFDVYRFLLRTKNQNQRFLVTHCVEEERQVWLALARGELAGCNLAEQLSCIIATETQSQHIRVSNRIVNPRY